MIKLTYDTFDEKLKKPEKTMARIFDGKAFISYNSPGKAQLVVNKMREDGKKGVLYDRGIMIQIFADKTEEEILAILKEDVINGLYVAEKTSGKKLDIKNMKVIKK